MKRLIYCVVAIIYWDYLTYCKNINFFHKTAKHNLANIPFWNWKWTVCPFWRLLWSMKRALLKISFSLQFLLILLKWKAIHIFLVFGPGCFKYEIGKLGKLVPQPVNLVILGTYFCLLFGLSLVLYKNIFLWAPKFHF